MAARRSCVTSPIWSSNGCGQIHFALDAQPPMLAAIQDQPGWTIDHNYGNSWSTASSRHRGAAIGKSRQGMRSPRPHSGKGALEQ